MQLPTKLLLIEDDPNIADALAHALRSNYQVDVVATGKRGIYKSEGGEYLAIILDLNLPDMAGLAVCQQMRERGVKAPILILTGESLVLTKINLLDAGANDYLTKPFSLGELKARLRVFSRQQLHHSDMPSQLIFGDLSLSPLRREVMRDGQAITLRRKEFALLECLMLHAGAVVSRQTLLQHAWQGMDEPWANSVDVHIKYLRDKLDRSFSEPLIKTVHGIGYRLDTAAQALGRTTCVD